MFLFHLRADEGIQAMEAGEEEEEEEDNELVVLDPSHVRHKCFYTSVLHYSDLP